MSSLSGHGTTTTSMIGTAVLVAACSVSCTAPEDNTDKPIARAYGEVLHWSDLRKVIPMDASPEDSTVLAQRYIESWMQQEVYMHLAESNLSADRLDLEEQLEKYRRDLVIFNYEQALVDQKLDVNVSEEDIVSYYEGHRSNFELKDNIVRARWFKVNEPDKRVIRKMEERFLSGDSEKLHELELWLARSGVTITDRSTSWTPYSQLLAEVPLAQPESDALLNANGSKVLKEGSAAWFVEIIDHRGRNSVSPLDLVRQDIRSILLNQRKLQLIEGMRKNVYKQALDNKDVEIYP
ncbi:MAG: hypothetical protein R2818_09550 [Flavobacteriales bacterium]